MPVIEQEFDSSGDLTMTRMNVLGARGIEAVINVPVSGSATMNWLMVDGHGNVVRTMNTNFGLSAYQWRGVWGERQTGTLQTRKGYVANLGHQEDETGLVYMRARYYEPTTGRFVSEDPARDGMNWYLYADGNPVNRVDASGKVSAEEMFSIFFYVQGTKFAMAAIGVLAGIAIDRPNYPKGSAGYQEAKRALALVNVLANTAAYFFGLSAVGLVSSQAANWIIAALPGIQLALAAIYSKATERALMTHASSAVALLVIQSTLQLGYIISIGAETSCE